MLLNSHILAYARSQGEDKLGARDKCLTHTGKPTGVAVSHCITWFQTQLILAKCQIRYHSHLWDHRSTGQLRTLIPRGHLEYCEMSRLRQLILV